MFTHLRDHLSIEQYRLLILGVAIYDSMHLSMGSISSTAFCVAILKYDLGYHLKVSDTLCSQLIADRA